MAFGTMSRDQNLRLDRIEDARDLLAYFHEGSKPLDQRRVGTEHEKFVFDRGDLHLMTYEEPGGFGDLFAELVEHYGWQPAFDRGNIVALERDGAALTLEPGGQFELSGAILDTVFETASEFDRHIAEIKALADDRLFFVPLGNNPLYGPSQSPWMPKARYEIMRRYLPTRGDMGHWMMQTTCTVQANFDYTSEADATSLIRCALLASPLVSALFAASPMQAGQPSGKQTFREHIWTRTDNDRWGFPEFMYRNDWGFEDYLEYLLDIPMFFLRREDVGYIDLSGQRLTFRQFIHKGFEGHQATLGDFELHMSTAFPEVRLKRYVEVRGADAGPRDFLLALPALWKGLLYHGPSRQKITELLEVFDPIAHRGLFETAIQDGIHGHTPHGPLIALAKEVLEASREGLDALARQAGHPSEAVFLAPIEGVINTRTSLADQILADCRALPENPRELIQRWAL